MANRKKSSTLILGAAIENAKHIQPPPDFEKAFMLIDEFNNKNMGAKSNNLLVLKGKIASWVNLPESGCIPFKMLEYTLGLEPDISKLINAHIEELNTTTVVKKMNRLLNKCKDLVMKLKFNKDDHHH